jgi:hypothetical protein
MRRNPNDIEQQTPEERMIGQAITEVENLGANSELTYAVQHLLEAKRHLGLWHDAGRPGESK